ncbi:uncharacterized protein LOC142168071 [Nicotiana tabacum]|uniref:Uncharacterized protein LOC142168071 n=1 Tax=Nicotiana tabacum TaxID=4097 RepID=A0AC58SIM4_TOBAC
MPAQPVIMFQPYVRPEASAEEQRRREWFKKYDPSTYSGAVSEDAQIDLMLFDMVDFEVILGMEWLSLYHAIFDCHANTMTLSMLGLPRLEWRGTLGDSTSRVVSYLKAQHMVEKECLAYLAYIRDFSAEVPSMDSVRVLSEFLEVFPTDLASMQSDKGIDLFIYSVSSTQPISITPYCMAPTELKDLTDKL